MKLCSVALLPSLEKAFWLQCLRTSLPAAEENKIGSRREIIFVVGVGRKVGRCACLLYDDGGVATRCLLLEVRFDQALMNSVSQVIHCGTMPQ